MKKNAFRSIAFAVVCMILGILIALQMKNVNSENLTENNLADLQNKLIEYANKNAELSDRNAELYDYISLLENDKYTGNEQIQKIISERERAAVFAGLREVKNSGFEIQVSCAKDILVRDSVLRNIVNELRGLGAQAIAVNDERLVAMSEIRASGLNIIINGNAFSATSKFTIKAITDPAKEQYIKDYLDDMTVSIVNSIQLESDQYSIQVDAVPELTIPALSEDSPAFKIDLLIQPGQE
jgi:uncharacterized protein YlxW (UPF0749 family)